MKVIEDVIIYLIRTQPFYAHLLSYISIIENDRVPIAGYSIKSGKIFLHINFFVFNQLSLENKTKILIHELLHIIARHSIRKGNKDHDIWNIACDVAINQMIEGIPIAQKVKFLTSKNNKKEGNTEKNIIEKEVGGLTIDNILMPDGNIIELPPNGFAEEYYNILIKHIPPEQDNEYHKFFRKNQEGDTILGSDLHPNWNDSEDIPEALIDNIVRNVINNTLKKTQGNIPAYLEIYVEKVLNTKTPWKRILKLFIAKHAYNIRTATFKKQNKRVIDIGLPGFRREKKLQVVVAIDTSGSISKNELAVFIEEITKIKKSGVDVTIIECDSEVKKVYKLNRELNLKISGRGGTDFRPVWQYIDYHKMKPDVIIYLTDGKGPAPESSRFPTLWAITSNGDKPWVITSNDRKTVDWGKFIKIVADE